MYKFNDDVSIYRNNERVSDGIITYIDSPKIGNKMVIEVMDEHGNYLWFDREGMWVNESDYFYIKVK